MSSGTTAGLRARGAGIGAGPCFCGRV